MRVTSSPGSGTTFGIVFPASDRRCEVARPLEPDEGARTGSGMVLVVDDDEFVQILAADTLTKGGFETVIAGDGVEALRIFRERAAEVAVVLLDLTMPNKGGHETFHGLRRIRPDVPVVLCSGYNEHEAIRRFPEEGLTGFLKKPYLPDDLVAAIRRALDGRPG